MQTFLRNIQYLRKANETIIGLQVGSPVLLPVVFKILSMEVIELPIG